MGGFTDVSYAGAFRDTVERIVEGVLNKLRPQPFLARVYSRDLSTQMAQVIRSGETAENLMTVRFGIDKIPSTVMATTYETDGENADCDIVRVAGEPGAYYILDFFKGTPQNILVNENSLHENPSFEDDRWDKNYPIGWESFWNTGAWSASLDSNDVRDGKYALRIQRPSGATIRVQAKTPFPVNPGETIRVSAWVKTDADGGVFDVGVITGALISNAQFFAGGTTQAQNFLMNNRNWANYSADFVVPSGHNFCRIGYRCALLTEGTDTNWLIDKTETSRATPVPWINMDGSSAGGAGILHPSYTNFGSGHAVPRYRKVGDEVQIEGLLQSNAGASNSICTLPLGYRPVNKHVFMLLSSLSADPIRCDVQPDGQLWLGTGTPGINWFSISGIQFSVL